MRNGFTSNHFNDSNGNPAGGTSFGVGFTIGWQNGPLGRGSERKKPTGAFVGDIIAAARDRISYYQLSGFACDGNADVLLHLGRALKSLDDRTRKLEEREVEGTHVV